MPRSTAPGTRERILEAAARLFTTYGVRAVGMQRVVDEAGVGKNVFYREFTGKCDLVAQWLRETDRLWWELAEAAIAPYDGDPARQLLAMVEFVSGAAADPAYRGCVFYSATLEFRDPADPAHREAVAHFDRLRQRLRGLAARAGAGQPDAVSAQLVLLVSGVSANASALGAVIPPTTALEITALALEAQGVPAGRPPGDPAAAAESPGPK